MRRSIAAATRLSLPLSTSIWSFSSTRCCSICVTCSLTWTSRPRTRSYSAVTAASSARARSSAVPSSLERTLEGGELGALAFEGSRQRLLRCPRVGELRAGSLEFCLWISGKGRAAWLSCDDVPPDRHQGHEGDDQMRPPPHRAVIRICNLPLCPVARMRGRWSSTPGGAGTGPKVLHASSTRTGTQESVVALAQAPDEDAEESGDGDDRPPDSPQSRLRCGNRRRVDDHRQQSRVGVLDQLDLVVERAGAGELRARAARSRSRST